MDFYGKKTTSFCVFGVILGQFFNLSFQVRISGIKLNWLYLKYSSLRPLRHCVKEVFHFFQHNSTHLSFSKSLDEDYLYPFSFYRKSPCLSF